LLRSYGAGLPLSVYRNYSQEMAALVQARLEGQAYDAVFVDHWLMAQYLPAGFQGLSLLHQHNAEHLIWQRQAALEMIPWRKLLLTLEGRRLRRYEATALPRLSWLFAVSERERQAIVDLGAPPQRVLLLPNLPDPRLLEQPPLKFGELPPHVLYVGTLSWQPNSQGLRSFLDESYPMLRREMPEVGLIVAGAEPPPWLQRLAKREDGLELVTPVEDAEPLYRRSRVFLETVRGGGGTKVKVLNALARGLPVVATPDGVDGIEAKADEHLLVAADAPSLVAAIRRLLEEERLWQRLSENGRALIAERYRPEVAYRPLERVLSGAA
ncbi:MAG: glycosyltransferase family 4 protein, partial [Dehalococcoidia bacterium]